MFMVKFFEQNMSLPLYAVNTAESRLPGKGVRFIIAVLKDMYFYLYDWTITFCSHFTYLLLTNSYYYFIQSTSYMHYWSNLLNILILIFSNLRRLFRRYRMTSILRVIIFRFFMDDLFWKPLVLFANYLCFPISKSFFIISALLKHA